MDFGLHGNRGNVWDKIASDWAGKEDWISKRKDKTSSADKTEFVHTYTEPYESVNCPQERERKMERKTSRLKTAEAIGPATAYTREDDPTVQLCGDSEVVGKRRNGKNSLGQKNREKLGRLRKHCTNGGKRRLQNLSQRLTTM